MCIIGHRSGEAPAASQNARGPENGQKEAGGGRGVVVAGCRGRSQREKVGWVPLAYLLCELLVRESSVQKNPKEEEC